MSVYLYTFRTENKTALFDGNPIKVYAYRFLCKAQDIDGLTDWDYSKRKKLLQVNAARSADLFAEHKPAFIATVHDDNWNGAVVYADPKGALWYDSDPWTLKAVGFLRKHGKGYVIFPEKNGEDYPIFCGHTFSRRYVEYVDDGEVERTIRGYICHANGANLTPAQFEEWRTQAEPAYLAECQKKREERKAADAEASRIRQEKLAAKDKEIAEARERLNALTHERAMI